MFTGIIEPISSKTYKLACTCTNSDDSNQSVNQHNLIRIINSHMLGFGPLAAHIAPIEDIDTESSMGALASLFFLLDNGSCVILSQSYSVP